MQENKPKKRFPGKLEALETLKARGLEVSHVIDVGIFEDTWDLRKAFPDAHHLLFEPLSHLESKIEENYKHVSHELIIAACSDGVGEGYLRLIRHNGPDKPVTHSLLSFTRPEEGEIAVVPMIRVDDAVKARNIEGRLLLKIDVDGAEMGVLRGCSGILQQVDVVVIECLHCAWLDRATFLTDAGFQLADIVDIVYYDDMFWQMDMVFISPRLYQDPRFQPYRGGGPDLSLFHGIARSAVAT